MNVSKAGRYPACVGACAQVYMPVCNVVFCDRKMLSCGSALRVCDWLDYSEGCGDERRRRRCEAGSAT